MLQSAEDVTRLPIRVTHVITGLNTGGAEMMLYKLLENADAKGLTQSVVSLLDGGTLRPKIEALGIEVQSLGIDRGAISPFGLFRLRSILQAQRPNVVQGWMYHANIAALLASILSDRSSRLFWNIRHALHDHQGRLDLTSQLIRGGSLISKLTEGVIFNSKISAKQHENIGYSPQKSIIIPNGFDCEKFKPDPELRIKVRQNLGIPTDAIVYGLIARFHPIKGHADFLAAASQVATQHPNAVFLLAGRDVSMENPALTAAIHSSELLKNLRLLGERDDVPSLMSALDVLVSPSLSEAFPNVIGEAMSTGVPCVATDVGDSADIVGDTGFIVPPRSPAMLAMALCKFAALSLEERSNLGEQARQHIQDRFSLPAIVSRYESLYLRKPLTARISVEDLERHGTK